MQDQPGRLDGPDFLDSIADAEAATNSHVNADAYRQRAREWRQLQADHDALATRNAQLQRSLDAARANLQQVA